MGSSSPPNFAIAAQNVFITQHKNNQFKHFTYDIFKGKFVARPKNV